MHTEVVERSRLHLADGVTFVVEHSSETNPADGGSLTLVTGERLWISPRTVVRTDFLGASR